MFVSIANQVSCFEFCSDCDEILISLFDIGDEMETAQIILTRKNDRKPRYAQRTQNGAERLPKWIRVVKNNPLDQAANLKNTVWDRDVCSGRVMIYKGICLLTGLELCSSLKPKPLTEEEKRNKKKARRRAKK